MFRDMKKTRVSCKECGTVMAAYSLCLHMEQSHRMVMPRTHGVDVDGGGSDTYAVSVSLVLKLVECPVDG